MSTLEWHDDKARCAAADVLESESNNAGKSYETMREKSCVVRAARPGEMLIFCTSGDNSILNVLLVFFRISARRITSLCVGCGGIAATSGASRNGACAW